MFCCALSKATTEPHPCDLPTSETSSSIPPPAGTDKVRNETTLK